jgi:hypothetical protein
VPDKVVEKGLGQRLEEEEVHEAIYQIFDPVLSLVFIISLRSLKPSGHGVQFH